MPENAKYANVKMPAAFLTPHESSAKLAGDNTPEEHANTR